MVHVAQVYLGVVEEGLTKVHTIPVPVLKLALYRQGQR